jgi:integrase
MSLNATHVQKAIDGKMEPGEYHDEKGLYLKVEKSGAARWQYRYMRHGRTRRMGLGSASAIGLADARDLHDKARNQLKQGIDPIDARKKKRKDERVEAAKQITLAEARAGWLQLQDWESPSTSYRETWLWAMYGEPKKDSRKYKRRSGPYLGSYMLSELAEGGGTLIIEAFTEIIGIQRYKKSAKYALQNLRNIIEWARDEDLFSGDNPVNLRTRPKSKFLKRLPSLEYETAHRRPMPWQDVPAFIARLRAERGTAMGGKIGGYCHNERPLPTEVIELQILTGGRPAQARLAQWPEFDLDNQTWTVPFRTQVNGKKYQRRKRKDPLVIYINRPAVMLLRAIKKRQEEKEGGLRQFVFSHGPALTLGKDYHPSYAWHRKETSKYGDSDFRYGGVVISAGAVQSYFKISMGVKNYDLHGFRGSFKQFQIQHLGVRAELAAEAVLHHQVGNYVRNVYAQDAQPYSEIKEVLDFWGAHCTGKKVAGAIPKRIPQEEKL